MQSIPLSLSSWPIRGENSSSSIKRSGLVGGSVGLTERADRARVPNVVCPVPLLLQHQQACQLPTVVALSSADPLVGYVVVDDLIQLYRDELTVAQGALSAATMRAVIAALRIALP